jgi:flagellin-like protein
MVLINLKINKRSVSPLIATILLIVVAVILVTVVLSFSKDFVSESLNDTKDVFKDSGLTGFVRFDRTLGNVVVVRNYHQTESATITSYELVSLGDSFWLNNIISLPENLELTPGRSISIDLGCVPDNSFVLSLYTTDNRIISVTIPSRAEGLNNCSSYDLPIESLLNNVESGSFEVNEHTIREGELVTNGGFDTDTSWNKGDSWSIENGIATSDGSGNTSARNMSQPGVVSSGMWLVTANVISLSSGNFRFFVGNLGFSSFISDTGVIYQIVEYKDTGTGTSFGI